MDLNTYLLETLIQDRLRRARQDAAARALAARAPRPPRASLRVSLGLRLIELGRWLRGPDLAGEPGV